MRKKATFDFNTFKTEFEKLYKYQPLVDFDDPEIKKRIQKVVFIHGVGEGVLKQEVRSILTSHGNIEFWDADFREYGSGATHVRIRGLFQ